MKKVILSAAALMCGAVVFAQTSPTINTSDVEQIGWLNNATVTQTGQNTSYVDQEFNRNQVSVTQMGVNWSSIDQSGDVGGLRSSGYSNEATVDQNGGQNAFQISDIDQEGDFNVANVDQDGHDNFSDITQGNNQNAENNQATVIQNGGDAPGNGNDAVVLQRWDNNWARVEQIGTRNSVNLEQASAPNNADANFASHYQNGDKNTIISKQFTSSAAGDTPYPINGFSNGELVVQTGDENYSILDQNGENNASVVIQLDGAKNSASDSYSNYADVMQRDQLNVSFIYQGMEGVTSDNTALVDQSGNGLNLSGIYQMGGNTATVTQHNP